MITVAAFSVHVIRRVYNKTSYYYMYMYRANGFFFVVAVVAVVVFNRISQPLNA